MKEVPFPRVTKKLMYGTGISVKIQLTIYTDFCVLFHWSMYEFYCPVALIISLALNFETRNYHSPTLLRITLTTIALLKFHTSFRIFCILERKALVI